MLMILNVTVGDLTTNNIPPYRVVCFSVFFISTYMSELTIAYAEYLERMLGQTDDLVIVDVDTVPEDANYPLLLEWADVA